MWGIKRRLVVWMRSFLLVAAVLFIAASNALSSEFDPRDSQKNDLLNAHSALLSGLISPDKQDDVVEINAKKPLTFRMDGSNSNCIEMRFKIFLLSGEGLPIVTRHLATGEQARTFFWKKPAGIQTFGRWISVVGTTKILKEDEQLSISFPINHKEAEARVTHPKFRTVSDEDCELNQELKIEFIRKHEGLKPNQFWDQIQLEKSRIPLKKVHIYGDLNEMLSAKRKRIIGRVDFGTDKFDNVKIQTAGVMGVNFNSHLPSMNFKSKQLGIVRARAIAHRHFGLEKLSDNISRSLGLISPDSENVFIYWNNQPLGIYYVERWSNNLLVNVRKPTNHFFQVYSKFIPAHDPVKTPFNLAVEPLATVKGRERQLAVSNIKSLLKLANKSLWQDDIAGFFEYVDKDSFYGWALNYMIMGSDHQTTYENFGIYFNPSTGLLEFLPRDVRSGPLTFFRKKNYYLSTVLSNSKYFLEFLHYSRRNLPGIKSAVNSYETIDMPKIIAATEFANFGVVTGNRYKISTYESQTLLQFFNNIRRNLMTLDKLTQDASNCYSSLTLVSHHSFELPSENFVISNKLQSTAEYETLLNNMLIRLGSEYKFFKSAKIPNDLPAHFLNRHAGHVFLNTKIDMNKESKRRESKGKGFIRCHKRDHQQINQMVSPGPLVPNSFYFKLLFTKTASGDAYTNRTKILPLFSTLEIPKGVTIKIKPGSLILMGPKASIYSKGTLKFQGEKARPIKVRPLFPLVSSFGGIGVIGPDVVLEMDYTEVIGGSLFYANPHMVATGMIHAYHADVKIQNSIFNKQEISFGVDDLLNFKNSKVSISNTQISGAIADAIDIDFAIGKALLDNLIITESGNDAIDTSGSEVLITNTSINGCGDKGFSLGENSNVFSQNNIIKRCDVGVGIKEANFISSGDKFTRNQIGVAAYVKKDGLRKPSFSMKKSHFENNAFDCGVQKSLSQIENQTSKPAYIYFPKKSKPDIRSLSRSDLVIKLLEADTAKNNEVVLEASCEAHLN